MSPWIVAWVLFDLAVATVCLLMMLYLIWREA